MYINSLQRLTIFSFLPSSPITTLVRSYLKSFDVNFNIFNHFDVSEYAHINLTSVEKEFRNLGIASELWRRSVTLCKEKNISVISSLCTCPETQKIASNLGFKEVQRKHYVELQGENPTVNFSRKPSPKEFAAEMILDLSSDLSGAN